MCTYLLGGASNFNRYIHLLLLICGDLINHLRSEMQLTKSIFCFVRFVFILSREVVAIRKILLAVLK